MKATRDALGDALMELAPEHPELYVVDCDISKSMKTTAFAAQYPLQHVNVGIAEQNAAGVCAGLATMGKRPVLSTYGVFASMRACEQIRTSICYPNLPVTIACSHAGLTPSNDGATHQAVEDAGILRTLPGMTVAMGADYASAKALTKAAILQDGPVYLRYTRDAVPAFYRPDEPFTLGQAKWLRKGGMVTVVSFGEMLHEVLRAEAILHAQDIAINILDMHTIKPLDTDTLAASLSQTGGRCVTVEDHSIIGGLGSAVAEWMAEHAAGRLKRIGIPDQFGQSGRYDELLAHYGMNAAHIVRAIGKVCEQ